MDSPARGILDFFPSTDTDFPLRLGAWSGDRYVWLINIGFYHPRHSSGHAGPALAGSVGPRLLEWAVMLFFFFWRDVGMEARTLEPIPEGFDLNTRSAKHSFDGSMLTSNVAL